MGSLHRPTVSFNVRKIAIIGAGPSGLAQAKYLLEEHVFEEIDIYEQQADVGGVWNYNSTAAESVPIPQTNPHIVPDKPTWTRGEVTPVFSSPMYDNLNTNIPKELMCFSELSFPSKSLLFPTRQDVQDYLIQYSQDIRHLIKFSMQVEEVRLSQDDGQDVWRLSCRSVITDVRSFKRYDAVVVANGHYAVPFIPAVPGITDFNAAYPGNISHSKTYRFCDVYIDKKCLVIGNAASGSDIGTQISSVCKQPLLNSIRTSSSKALTLESKEEVPPIAEFLVADRGVRFENGRVETEIDAILYCTGYLYSYPILRSLDPPVVTNGRRVLGIYQQIFHILHPTLAFIGLPQKVIPFPLSEAQAAVVARVWAGRLDLPSTEEMKLAEKEDVEARGNSASFHVLGYPTDAEYINGLHDWAQKAREIRGKEPIYWDEEKKWIRSLYLDLRRAFIEGGGEAKSMTELGFNFEIEKDR